MDSRLHFSRSKPTCPLADPAQSHKLCRRRSNPPLSICYSCKGEGLQGSRYHYYCATCNVEFHRGCHLFPDEKRHPFHPSHPLTLISPYVGSDNISHVWNNYSSSDSDGVIIGMMEDSDDEDGASLSVGKCRCCRKRRIGIEYYHCSICNFNFDMFCLINPPPLTISHQKSHVHTLTVFPRRLLLPCDACGLSLNDTKDLVYSCLPCSYTVHRICIYLPRVIKITRHLHRLSLTSSLPSGDFSCGVCRRAIDINYGHYSCNKGCPYAVHSKCATRYEVWDGQDLEGVPEEEEEDIEPFVRIDEETILHFSHKQHYLKLHKKIKICEEDMFCEACTLPITILQSFYSCMQCDYVLDEACASLPLKKHLPLHRHPLTLHTFPSPGDSCQYEFMGIYVKGIFKCNGCRRYGCGFVYKCDEENCGFQLDIRCASLPDPLLHGCHDHPLFFNLTKGNCMGCSNECSYYFLECMQCNFFLGLTCAALPCEAHYKHDKHPLTLCYGEGDTTSGQYWCEICEAKLNSKTWFYTCDSCRITIHVNCLLGKAINIKPRHVIKIGDGDNEFQISRNDGNSRMICIRCKLPSAQALVFKSLGIYGNYCTLDCMTFCEVWTPGMK